MSESIISPVALTVAKKKFTEPELVFQKQLAKAERVDVLVPQEINPEDFRNALSYACKGYAKAELQKEALYPVVGQLMLVAQNHPELWDHKHENYEAFAAAISKEFGVSRSTLFESRKMVARWGPLLNIDDFQAIGRNRMKTVSSVVPVGSEREVTAKKLIKVAASGTPQELDEYIEANYHKSRPDRVGAVFEIPCNKAQESRYTKFFNNPKIQSYVESDKWAEIMDSLIAECSQEWIDKGEAKQEATAEEQAAAAPQGNGN